MEVQFNKSCDHTTYCDDRLLPLVNVYSCEMKIVRVSEFRKCTQSIKADIVDRFQRNDFLQFHYILFNSKVPINSPKYNLLQKIDRIVMEIGSTDAGFITAIFEFIEFDHVLLTPLYYYNFDKNTHTPSSQIVAFIIDHITTLTHQNLFYSFILDKLDDAIKVKLYCSLIAHITLDTRNHDVKLVALNQHCLQLCTYSNVDNELSPDMYNGLTNTPSPSPLRTTPIASMPESAIAAHVKTVSMKRKQRVLLEYKKKYKAHVMFIYTIVKYLFFNVTTQKALNNAKGGNTTSSSTSSGSSKKRKLDTLLTPISNSCPFATGKNVCKIRKWTPKYINVNYATFHYIFCQEFKNDSIRLKALIPAFHLSQAQISSLEELSVLL